MITGIVTLWWFAVIFVCGLLILNALAARWGAPVGEILQKGPVLAMPFRYLWHVPAKNAEGEDPWYKSEVGKMTTADLLFVRKHINAKYVVRHRIVVSALEALGMHEEQIAKGEARMKSSLVMTTCAAFFLASFINWFVFFAISVALGGDGLGGKVENGKYYVVWHGRYNEVQPSFFTFSSIHAAYSVGTFAFALICLVIVSRGRGFDGFFTLRYRSWQRWIIFGIPGGWTALFLLLWAWTGFRVGPLIK